MTREPVPQDSRDVPDHSTSGRGDYADGFRKMGQRPLVRRVKESLGLEPSPSFLDHGQQRALARGFQPVDDQLIS